MRKTFKISGTVALVAVIGFFMTACPDDNGDSPAKPEYFITITDIPSAYNGMFGALKLFPPDPADPAVYSSKPAAFSTEVKISATSVTLPLFKWSNLDPWSGTGSYRITIYIFENRIAAANELYKYVGKIENDITEKTTFIEWALCSFTPKP